MYFQKYMHVRITCLSEISAFIIHFYVLFIIIIYACHYICLSEIYASCQKYMQVRNICIPEIHACMKYKHVRNLEIYYCVTSILWNPFCTLIH